MILGIIKEKYQVYELQVDEQKYVLLNVLKICFQNKFLHLKQNVNMQKFPIEKEHTTSHKKAQT